MARRARDYAAEYRRRVVGTERGTEARARAQGHRGPADLETQIRRGNVRRADIGPSEREGYADIRVELKQRGPGGERVFARYTVPGGKGPGQLSGIIDTAIDNDVDFYVYEGRGKEQRWYTVKEAAKIVKRSQATVRRWARTGVVTAEKRNRRWYLDADEIDARAQGRKQR